MNDKNKLGNGGRFAELSKKLARKGVDDPKALAAKIGVEKYGQKKMSGWAAKGRERAES
jgi:hypothetical protein